MSCSSLGNSEIPPLPSRTYFTLETDHKPLEWLESHRQSHARFQRLEWWSLELRAYDFKITYRPGKNNQCADTLSGCPVTIVG